MKTFQLVAFIAVLVLCAATTVWAQGYTVTATLDYESYDSTSYVRFTIDDISKLPTAQFQQTTLKLFDIQLPSAFSNLEGTSPDCTRDASGATVTTSGTVVNPFFTYKMQNEERRGFELMYPSSINSSSLSGPLHCVIRIKKSPVLPITQITPNFTITLLAAGHIFTNGAASTTNRKQLSFVLPSFYTGLTSTRVYPDAYPFLFPNEDYTTSMTIDSALLSLRKNNKLIVKYPFSFTLKSSLSFCSSPHTISAYDYAAQSPVESSTTVNALAISLTSYSSVAQAISCYLVVTTSIIQPLVPTFKTTYDAITGTEANGWTPTKKANDAEVVSIAASQVSFELEYSHYDSTGSTGDSNFFYSFIQRTFTPLDPKNLFPAYDPAVVLATPPLVTHSRSKLSPIFLSGKDTAVLNDPEATFEGFWNRFSVELEYYAFGTSQVLWVPAPSGLGIQGDCLQKLGTELTFIQVDSCTQAEATLTCPDFDFRLAMDHLNTANRDEVLSTGGDWIQSPFGAILTPKEKLRFTKSTCYYNFNFTPTTFVSQVQTAKVRLINNSDLYPVALSHFAYILSDELHNPISRDTQLQIFSSPTVTLSPSSHPDSFISPFVGGRINVTIDANATPLFNGYRIEVLGPRLTSMDNISIAQVSTRVESGIFRTFKLDLAASSPTCNDCFRLSVEELSYDRTDPNAPTYLFPVLTFYTSNDSGLRTSFEVTLNYPGTQLLSTQADFDELTLIKAYHYKTELNTANIFVNSETKLTEIGPYIPNAFFTLAKSLDDIYDVLDTINFVSESAGGGSGGTTPYKMQSTEDEDDVIEKKSPRQLFMEKRNKRRAAFAPQSTSNSDVLAMDTMQSTTASSDEWYIYDEGYIGIALSQVTAKKGDIITFDNINIQFMANITSISNVVNCVGAIGEISPSAELSSTLLIISTEGSSIKAVFNQDITRDNLLVCTAPITPRTPAEATELLSLPTLKFFSQQFKPNSTTFDGCEYILDVESDTSTSSTAFEYPFMYEIPLDISNLSEQKVVLTSLDAPDDEPYSLYTGSYATLQLRVEGRELEEGQSNVITIDFSTGRLAAVDQDLSTILSSARKLQCNNAEVSINYNTKTKVEITLFQRVVATKLDPFICQFSMMVGTGIDSFDDPIITFGSTGSSDKISNPRLNFNAPPYEVAVTQSAGNMTFSMNRMGPLPILFLQVTPFTSVDTMCVSSTGDVIATVDFSQAVGILIVTPVQAYTAGISMYNSLGFVCSFTATKKFSAPSTTVYFQLGSQVLADTLTLPAISVDYPNPEVDITFSSIQLPWNDVPIHGVMFDLYQTAMTTAQSVSITLPTGARLAPVGLPLNELFVCDQRIDIATKYDRKTSSYVLTFTPNTIITAYDQVTCAVRLDFGSPVRANPAVSWSGNVGTNQTTSGTTNWAEVSSEYTLYSSYTLQYPMARSRLEMILEVEYTSLHFDVRSNKLVFDLSGMKSPVEKIDFKKSAGAGGDPTVRTKAEAIATSSTNSTDTTTTDTETTADMETSAVGIRAGDAVILQMLTAVDCYVPVVNSLGQVSTDKKVSAQYIRETGYKLAISLPAVKAKTPIVLRCVIPVFIYNQQFRITPLINEYPTSRQLIRSQGYQDSLPNLIVTTFFPSPSIEVIEVPNDNTTPGDGSDGTSSDSSNPNGGNGGSHWGNLSTNVINNGSSSRPSKWGNLSIDGSSGASKWGNLSTQSTKRAATYVNRSKFLGSNHPQLQSNIIPYITNSNKKSAEIIPVDPSTIVPDDYNPEDDKYLFFGTETAAAVVSNSADPSNTNTTATDPTTPDESQDPRSSVDQTQDIRYLEILFKHEAYFTNDELDDIVTIIHSLVSKRDRTINLNSIIVIGQFRPPLENADQYILLRLGFAGLDVESTLLEAKFAGLDYMHWLSNTYQVESSVYGNDFQYRYDRTKVPITCLTTSAALNQITRSCGSECGRTCPNDYSSSGAARPCRTDFDCESFSCSRNYRCGDMRWNYIIEYTGVYTHYNTPNQRGISAQTLASFSGKGK